MEEMICVFYAESTKDGRHVSTSSHSPEMKPKYPDTNAAIFHIWNHSLHSTDPEMEPQYQGPAHTWARPILSQPQLSVMKFNMKFNLIFISSNNKLKPNLWETWTIECDKNDLKWH